MATMRKSRRGVPSPLRSSLVAFLPLPSQDTSSPFRRQLAMRRAQSGSIINRQPKADLDVPSNVRYWG